MSSEDAEQEPLKLYAFWKYDRYPFYLGGVVTRMRADGCIETEGYGKQYWFRPVRLLPWEAGKALHEKLKALEVAHLQAKDAFDAEWGAKLEALNVKGE